MLFRSQSEIQKVLKNIQEKDPQKPISQKLKVNKNNENELISEQSDNFQIKFELQNKKINLKNKQKGDISVGIPNSEQMDSVDLVEDKLVYSGKDAKFEVIVEAIDGGMRQVINIKDNSAPDFYDFPVELGLDEKLVINTDGSADFIKSNKIVKATIGKPWAKDVNGKDLKTSYSVENGNILRQKIELKDAVFPVVADPIWCGNQISSVQWQGWRNPISLGVIPTYCGRFLSNDTWAAWSELYSMTPYHWQWNWEERSYGTTKYWSMYNQFICHQNNAAAQILEGEWNLEPSRPNVGLQATYWALCNP